MNIKIRRIVITEPYNSIDEDIEIEVPSNHNILVKVIMSGICTAEQRVFKGTSNKNYPYWGGHELFGIVERVFKGDSVFKKGDVVAISLMDRCGHCYYCKSKLDNHCAYVNNKNEYEDDYDGTRGFSNYITIPDSKAFLIDNDIPHKYLSFIEPTACVLRSIELAEPIKDNVGIIGLGTFGIIHSIVLKALGYNVHVFGDEEQLKQVSSLELAGYHKILELSDMSLKDKISTFFCTKYGYIGLEHAINYVDRGGKIILFQSIANNKSGIIDYNKIHYKEIAVQGSIAHNKRNFENAIQFIEKNFKYYKCLHVKEYSPTKHNEAFTAAISNKYNRIIFKYDGYFADKR